MFRSSASLMAEDVTVRCRVRRSKYAHSFEEDDAQDMACTMRNWEGPTSVLNQYYNRRRKSFLPSLHPPPRGNGPEILLTPLDYRDEDATTDNNDNHNQGNTNSNRESTVTRPCSIAIEDILVLQRHPSDPTKLYITTMQAGSFELGGLTANGHDILLTFLQASLEPERICFLKDATNHPGENIASTASSVSSCLDFDTLQDIHVQNRANAETWPEKLSRRFGRVVHNLTELSGNICDTACCVDQREPAPSSNDYPASAYYTSTTSTTPRMATTRRPMMMYQLPEESTTAPVGMTGPSKIWKMPSGLSVESEADQSSVPLVHKTRKK